MGLYSGGLIIGRIFASEIWGAYFREGLLLLLLFFFLGGGLIIEILRYKPRTCYWNFTVFAQKLFKKVKATLLKVARTAKSYSKRQKAAQKLLSRRNSPRDWAAGLMNRLPSTQEK